MSIPGRALTALRKEGIISEPAVTRSPPPDRCVRRRKVPSYPAKRRINPPQAISAASAMDQGIPLCRVKDLARCLEVQVRAAGARLS